MVERDFLRGSFGLRAVSRFVLVLQIFAFAAGNFLYPTYKIGYLENRVDQASHNR